MKKIIILLLFIFVTVGCQEKNDDDVINELVERHYEQEELIENLYERIAELEEELGNFKGDVENGLYE